MNCLLQCRNHPACAAHRLRCASLGSSAYCKRTPVGPDPEAGALTRLVITAPAALRHENLCILPAGVLVNVFLVFKRTSDVERSDWALLLKVTHSFDF